MFSMGWEDDAHEARGRAVRGGTHRRRQWGAPPLGPHLRRRAPGAPRHGCRVGGPALCRHPPGRVALARGTAPGRRRRIARPGTPRTAARRRRHPGHAPGLLAGRAAPPRRHRPGGALEPRAHQLPGLPRPDRGLCRGTALSRVRSPGQCRQRLLDRRHLWRAPAVRGRRGLPQLPVAAGQPAALFRRAGSPTCAPDWRAASRRRKSPCRAATPPSPRWPAPNPRTRSSTRPSRPCRRRSRPRSRPRCARRPLAAIRDQVQPAYAGVLEVHARGVHAGRARPTLAARRACRTAKPITRRRSASSRPPHERRRDPRASAWPRSRRSAPRWRS